MPSATREKLIRGGFDSSEIAEMDRSYEEFSNLLKGSTHEDFHEKYRVFKEKDPNHSRNLHNRFINNSNAALRQIFMGQLVLNLPLPLPKSNWIECRGSVGTKYFDCIVSCGHWHKLKPTYEEMSARQLNLIEHLHELLPSHGRDIGLFTFQNGIDNLKEDLKRMGDSILKNIPEKPLCIGLYNPTKGKIHDLSGVLDKLSGLLSDTICITAQFFSTLADTLFKINPGLHWAYIAHSEGGLIAESALTMLNKPRWSSYFRQNLLIATYGAVLPIPKSFANAINTYSKKDGATWPRVESYIKSLEEDANTYVIKTVEGNSTDNLPFFPFGFTGFILKTAFECVKGDHDFQGDSYQGALKNDIKDFFRNNGLRTIYDGK